MFLYAWLHIAGYDVSIDDLRKFRKPHSKTPGHPEFSTSKHHTPGVEATTGPLGAGIGNAVGMAAAAKLAAARYNTAEHSIIDHHVIALCGDGCLQEGVAFEAASYAGHEGLGNLILIFDSNNVTLDQMAGFTQSEDHAARFAALGWNVLQIDGHDIAAIDRAMHQAKTTKNNKPTLIIAKTVIGKGISEVQGTSAAHGEAGMAHSKQAKDNLGLPTDCTFYVSEETRQLFEARKAELSEQYSDWKRKYKAWQVANPIKAAELVAARTKNHPKAEAIISVIPAYDRNKNVATRQSSLEVLQHVAKLFPLFISGSADLHSSTKNYIKDGGNFGNPTIPNKSYRGRNFFFGIREHAMGTMLNGMAYYGLHIPSGATFLAFADYMRPAIRIAALSELPVIYILTHDSAAVGEDGPTHQSVEGASGLRVIPNLDVIRPADPEEVVGAFAAALDRQTGPTALVLTRQNVRTLNEVPLCDRRKGVLKGGYVARLETTELTHIVLASGSELQWALDAALELGPGVRVVSIPCMERFDRQSREYQDSVLPPSCHKRVAIEAGITGLWYKYVGLQGKVIGTDAFGFSAPGDLVLREFGISTENLLKVIKGM